MDLDGSTETLWGALNAVVEYIDHYRKTESSGIGYALLGEGMEIKARAFGLIQNELAKAA